MPSQAKARVTAAAPGMWPAMNSPASGVVVVSLSPTIASSGTVMPGNTPRCVVGDHAEHSTAKDIGRCVGHESGPEIELSW